MLTRLHISSFVGLTIAVWLFALWVQGSPILSLEFVKPFSIVVGIIFSVAAFFNKSAWAWPIFQGWYVKRPDIRGMWKVELVSDYVDEETNKPIPAIEAYAAVRQSLNSLSLRLMTKESRSKLVAHSIVCEEDGLFRLAAVYRNEPKIQLQGERSEIHYGSLSLEIYGVPPTGLEGHYWTDRGTRGSMLLKDRRKELYDTYDLAKAAFDRTPTESELNQHSEN